MKFRSKLMITVCLISAVQLSAATLTDNFNNGISLMRWDVGSDGYAPSAPWTITAQTGAVDISKSADNGVNSSSSRPDINAGMRSSFELIGDFSVSIDFNILALNNTSLTGQNAAIFEVVSPDSSVCFRIMRYSLGNNADYLKAESQTEYGIGAAIGLIPNNATYGTFEIARHGTTFSAWLHEGGNAFLIGSDTSDLFLQPMQVEMFVAQWITSTSTPRPSTAIDVQFDNLAATAEVVIPEPATMLLLGLGGMMLRKKL